MRIEQALAQVKAKRQRAQRRAEAYKAQRLAQVPALAYLDSQIAAVRMALLAAQEPQQRQALLAQLDDLRQAFDLEWGQQPADEGEEAPCAFCGDTGYADGALCACVRRLVLGSLSFGQPDPECTFEKVDLTRFLGETSSGEPLAAWMARLYERAKDFAGNFNQPACTWALEANGPVCAWTLMGPVGTGKSYLAQCIANAAQDHGHTAVVVSSFELNQTFRFGHEREAALCDSVDLLVIDDLGTEPLWNNVTVEGLLGIVSSRLARRRGLVITTNHTPQELIDRYGERLFSRLTDRERAFAVQVPGRDLRGIKCDSALAETSKTKAQEPLPMKIYWI